MLNTSNLLQSDTLELHPRGTGYEDKASRKGRVKAIKCGRRKKSNIGGAECKVADRKRFDSPGVRARRQPCRDGQGARRTTWRRCSRSVSKSCETSGKRFRSPNCWVWC